MDKNLDEKFELPKIGDILVEEFLEPLSKYFGTTSKFWLNMQNELDLREMQEKLGNDLDKIPSCKKIA